MAGESGEEKHTSSFHPLFHCFDGSASASSVFEAPLRWQPALDRFCPALALLAGLLGPAAEALGLAAGAGALAAGVLALALEAQASVGRASSR